MQAALDLLGDLLQGAQIAYCTLIEYTGRQEHRPVGRGDQAVPAHPSRARRPELLVEHAIKGMLPHNRLGRSVFTKLKVYRGATHPHAAQQPVAAQPGK